MPLNGPEKPTVWKCQVAPESQRLHGRWRTWPQEAMENSNVDQVQQVDHWKYWNSRSLYNSNMVSILTLRMVWASAGLVSSGQLIQTYHHICLQLFPCLQLCLCAPRRSPFLEAISEVGLWISEQRHSVNPQPRRKVPWSKKNKASKITNF